MIGRAVTLGRRVAEYAREPQSLLTLAPVAVSVVAVLILSPWVGDVFGRGHTRAEAPPRKEPAPPTTVGRGTTSEEPPAARGEVEQYVVQANSGATAFSGALELRLIAVRLGDRGDYVADFSVDSGSGPIGYRNVNVGFAVTAGRRYRVQVESVRFANAAAVFSVTRIDGG